MKVTLLSHTPDPEINISRCASVCYDSAPKDIDRSRKMISSLIRSGHTSTLEHSSASFELDGVSRVLTHELVRHRLFSFSQRSQRYVDESIPSYVVPNEIRDNPKAMEVYAEAMKSSWSSYAKLQSLGLKNEIARYVLPNACSTKICVSGNFREYRNFLKLRLSKRAQREIREVATIILENLISIAPSCFEDLRNEENLQNT